MDAHDSAHDTAVEVELRGLSIYTHHGVSDAEQEIGQRLELDVSFDVPDCDAVLTDRVEDTIDYGEVADIVALAATERSYRTLERLCHVIAERLMERFGCESVRVRAAKPEPPLPLAIEEVGVEVVRTRFGDDSDDDGEEGAVAARVGYLGLGSNVGDRADTCGRRSSCSRSTGSRSRPSPRVYETEPVGEILDQPDFLNAAVRIAHRARARGAARCLQGNRGRAGADVRRAAPWPAAARRRPAAAGRRRARDRAALTLPHPQVTQRRFVLEPLLELDARSWRYLTGRWLTSSALGALRSGRRSE